MSAFRGIAIPAASSGGGGGSASKLVQVVNTMVSAFATGSVVIPLDDSIPQNTEGTEYMSLAITPTNVNNKLKITVVFNGSGNGNFNATIALFQDSTVNAIAAVNQRCASETMWTQTFVHYMTAGTVSSTTFKVRAGPETASSVAINGRSGARIMGGVEASSITIEEILV